MTKYSKEYIKKLNDLKQSFNNANSENPCDFFIAFVAWAEDMHIDYKHRSNIKKLTNVYDKYIEDDYISGLLNPNIDDLIWESYDYDDY